MNTDTTIAKNIRVADEKASYDAACKRLLSEKIILAWIMKNCLEEYRDCDVDEIAEKYIEGTPQLLIKLLPPQQVNAVVTDGFLLPIKLNLCILELFLLGGE